MDGDAIFFSILYTFLYTIVSVIMSFKIAALLNDDPSVERLARHFVLWPIETLFIGILVFKIYINENKKERRK